MTLPEDNNIEISCPIDHGSGSTQLHVDSSHAAATEIGTIQITTLRTATFDYYSCEEAIKRLNDYLDAELNPGEREDVVKHLQVCAPCLERFHFEKNLIISLRDKVKQTIAPLNLRDRLSSLMKSGKSEE